MKNTKKKQINQEGCINDLEEGEFVMVHLRKGQFPTSSYSKLKNTNFRLCQVLKKLIAMHMWWISLKNSMSSTFNMTDLKKYYPPDLDDWDNEDECCKRRML